MAKMKEIKAIHSFNFYSHHYLEEALENDLKTLSGIDGSSFKKLKDQWIKAKDQIYEQKHTGIKNGELREEIIKKFFTELGYYRIPADGSSQEVIKTKNENTGQVQTFKFPVERKLTFKGANNGSLWLMIHHPTLREEERDSILSEKSLAKSTSGEFRLTWKKLIDKIFDADEFDADWILVNSGESLYLFEIGKWQEEGEAYLEINLSELYELHDNKYYRAAEALVSPNAFPIRSAEFLHEKLFQNAHRKAAEVTKSLRDRVRESIEIIANGVLEYHRKSGGLKAWKHRDLSDPKDRNLCAKELMEQSMRYIYRMLFAFFTESQSQAKGSLPVQSEIYQRGYAIEKLRDLEGVLILNQGYQSRGNFIQCTLDRMTNIYFSGYRPEKLIEKDPAQRHQKVLKTDALGFRFPSLGTKLFDIHNTPLIHEARLSDKTMQEVLKRLSLAQMGTGQRKRTYRVHYAGLGLNQLGAVYEGLLSLTPEILGERVILLKIDPKEDAPRFIPYAKKHEFPSENLDRDEEGNLKIKDEGEFLLTPLGVERKMSASFYTPEMLTRFIAKETVESVLGKDPSLKKMEGLKILEPAMGSGAFLNAVVDEIAPKMAKHYKKLDSTKNGAETKEEKTFEYYKQKSKEYLMRHCVYGVDLNPIAVELAQISIWLNCLHEKGNLPFLDFKIRVGNSLIGAWVNRFRKKKICHFLFPAPDALDTFLSGTILANKKRPVVEDKNMRERLNRLKQEYRALENDTEKLKKMCAFQEKIEALYQKHVQERKFYIKEIQSTENSKERQHVFDRYIKENSSYHQLKMMMDLWCALWFWPVNRLKELPSVNEYLEAISWLCDTELSGNGSLETELDESNIRCLKITKALAMEKKFFHYDLEFAEVMSKGGFDLVLGNPPWVSLRWEEVDFFEQRVPGVKALKGDAKTKHSKYEQILSTHPKWQIEYQQAVCSVKGLIQFLKKSGTYAFEDHSKTNTYKYFYQRFYALTKKDGIYSMMSQDGVLKDEGSKKMRPLFYREAVKVFRFQNKINLFEDVGMNVKYMVFHAKKGKKQVGFQLIDHLYHPETVKKCSMESEKAPYRGMKDEHGRCELRGHPKRIIHVNEEVLHVFAQFFGEGKETLEASLPTIHGQIELEILKTLALHPKKLGDLKWKYTQSFHETMSSKKGWIRKNPGTRKELKYAVLTGPNIFVGNPANKTPNPDCKNHTDFSAVDLKKVSDNYFPDTVYECTEKGLNSQKYRSQTPWGSVMVEQNRLILRRMVDTTGARTLSSAIIPPCPTHIHLCVSLAFQEDQQLVYVSGLFHSLIYDFLMRSISGGDISQGILKMAPALTQEQLNSSLVFALMCRALRLSAISNHYGALWKKVFEPEFKTLSVQSPFQPELPYSELTDTWQRNTCIRDPKAREQALCEIDAIVAILFGFDKQLLLDLYRSQFGVLQKNWQDLPNQKINREKDHFPRFKQMSEAYDQISKFEPITRKAA